MDGIIRKNAGVSLGDRVTVRKVDAKTCTKLTISPVMANKQKVKFGPGIEGFAKEVPSVQSSLETASSFPA